MTAKAALTLRERNGRASVVTLRNGRVGERDRRSAAGYAGLPLPPLSLGQMGHPATLRETKPEGMAVTICDVCTEGYLWIGSLNRLVPCPVCLQGSRPTPKHDPPTRRDLVFSHYGRFCACCGTTEILTIDHVYGGGREHMRAFGLGNSGALYRWLIANDFPAGFQTLCQSCNSSKRTFEHCRQPHPEKLQPGWALPSADSGG